MKILILSAVEQELDYLNHHLKAVIDSKSTELKIHQARFQKIDLYLSVSGIGVIASAFNLGRLVDHIRPDQILMTGSGGAFPDSELTIGDVVIGTTEVMAELGLAAGIGIGDGPALNLPGYEQEIDLDGNLCSKLIDSSPENVSTTKGRLLTVVGVSADYKQANDRGLKFHCKAENMEGYALAFAGRLYKLPAAEIRGISNMAGERDKSKWDMPRANQAAQKLLLNYLETIKC